MFDSLQPVILTPTAAAEARKIMQTKNIPEGYGLRVGVRGGHGCGGVSFIIHSTYTKPPLKLRNSPMKKTVLSEQKAEN